MDIDPAENEAPYLKKVLRNFRYGLIYDISSVGVFFTSVFITAFYPARGAARGQAGNGSAVLPVSSSPHTQSDESD